MFIQQLSKTQQSIFLSFANELMGIDGDVSTSEENMLNFYKSQMEDGVIAVAREQQSLSLIFDTQKSKMAMVLELVGLGHADGDYDKDEKDFIRSLASQINLTEQDVVKCESWVSKQIVLISEANEMLEV